MTIDQIEHMAQQLEETELRGVLPSIQYIIDHLAQFDDQFALAIKHLDNAAKATVRIAVSS